MKTNGAWKTGRTFLAMTGAALALAGGTAAAQDMAAGDAPYCRCDARTGQEMLDSLVKDIRQRGMAAEAAEKHAAACIASWCACSGEESIVRSCVSEAKMDFGEAMGVLSVNEAKMLDVKKDLAEK